MAGKKEKRFAWECPLTFKYYLLASVYRITRSIFGKIYLIILFILIALYLSVGDYAFTFFLLGLIMFILLFIPLIRFLSARFYYKFKSMEYFVTASEVGYQIGSYKMEVKLENVAKIVLKNNHFLVVIGRDKLMFWGSEGDLKKAVELLQKTKYGELIVV